MWNDASNYKKVTFIVFVSAVIILIFNFYPKINFYCYAESVDKNSELEQEFNSNVNDILNDIDSSDLDDYIDNDINLNFLNTSSFKELIIKVLNGTYFDEYDSLFQGVVDIFKTDIKSLMKIFLIFLSLVLFYETFKNFCVDKYSDFKNVIRFIFSTVIILLIFQIFQDISSSITDLINKIFSFSKILFPILLNLILISGAKASHTVYSSLSLFLLNSGSYLFTYFLLPISISIFVLTLFGSISSSNKFEKVIDIFKLIFKYSVIIFFALFGLFSSVNLITSGASDGVSLRLTKYAIKNYIPIVGGYVSQGFDFIHSCSVVIKNSFGLCGLIILIFIVLKPLILYFAYLFLFKILSAVVSLVSSSHFSNMFNNMAKTMSYFISIIVSLFFIMFVFIYLIIVSVSVV